MQGELKKEKRGIKLFHLNHMSKSCKVGDPPRLDSVRLMEDYHYYGAQRKMDESIHINQHDL